MINLKGVRVGYALTGSFCTFSNSIQAAKTLSEQGAVLTPIFRSTLLTLIHVLGKQPIILQHGNSFAAILPFVPLQMQSRLAPKYAGSSCRCALYRQYHGEIGARHYRYNRYHGSKIHAAQSETNCTLFGNQ